MRQLSLIIRKQAQQDMTDFLRAMPQVHGFTLSHVEGHGEQAEDDPFLSARDKVVGYTPRVRIDVVLSTGDVDVVITALKEAVADGSIKSAYYWVATVENAGHL